jgi:poly(3-hydroxybutyrate) depolymerase
MEDLCPILWVVRNQIYLKAVASITGTMSGYDWQNCSPAYKIPILQMSGTNDRTVPWDGTMNTALGWGRSSSYFRCNGVLVRLKCLYSR